MDDLHNSEKTWGHLLFLKTANAWKIMYWMFHFYVLFKSLHSSVLREGSLGVGKMYICVNPRVQQFRWAYDTLVSVIQSLKSTGFWFLRAVTPCLP